MKKFLVYVFVFFSVVCSQAVAPNKEANLSFDEDAKRQHVQSIDGVAAVVGDRVVLKSDINAKFLGEIKVHLQKDDNVFFWGIVEKKSCSLVSFLF